MQEKNSDTDTPTDYLRPAPDGDGIYLKIIIQPRASKEIVVGLFNGSLKVKVNAPPVEGAANKSLVAILSKLLGVAKSNIEIIQGETSRNKLLHIKGITLGGAKRYIETAISGGTK